MRIQDHVARIWVPKSGDYLGPRHFLVDQLRFCVAFVKKLLLGLIIVAWARCAAIACVTPDVAPITEPVACLTVALRLGRATGDR